MDEERELLERIAKGSWEAYELLFITYQPRLIIFINGFTGDKELAHDIAQDIFLSIWEKRDTLRDVRFFSSYLFRIAKNKILNYFKHLIVQRKFIDEMKRKEIIFCDSSDDYLFLQELKKNIEIQLNNTPKRRRDIFHKSRYEGLSNAEIASQMNISKRTVENNISLVLSELKKKLTCLF